MDIGVVLQTTPPSARVVDLAVRAESYGFSHVWTFDSHILWQEPFVLYSQILDRTRNVVVGPMVTNPATRDWTVTASLFATLNEMYGNRTVCGIGRGDSAVRVINGKPVKLAELREAIGVIRGLANGDQVEYKGSSLRLNWNPHSRLEIWVAAYGPKALALAGEAGDGFILQLADPAITEWSIAAVRRAAEEAGKDPDSGTICVAAPAYVTEREGYDYNEHGRAGNTHTMFVTDEIVDRFCLIGPPEEHVRKLRELADLGVDQFALYLQHDAKDARSEEHTS